MPNYCSNRLTVSGDAKELKKFIKKGLGKGEDKIWSISNYVPTPKKLLRTVSPTSTAFKTKYVNDYEVKNAIEKQKKDSTVAVPKLIVCENRTQKKCDALIKKYGADNWYEWNCANWGIKWDCSCEDGEYQTDGKTYFTAEFDSAWCPPIKWLEKVQEKYPKLFFKLVYSEGGCFFGGVAYTQKIEEYDVPYIEDESGDLEYRDEEGVKYTYNSETENYVSEDGSKTLTYDDFMDMEVECPYNPYSEYVCWFE